MPNPKPSTELSWYGLCAAVYYAALFKSEHAARDPYHWTPAKRRFWLQAYLHTQARVVRALAGSLWP